VSIKLSGCALITRRSGVGDGDGVALGMGVTVEVGDAVAVSRGIGVLVGVHPIRVMIETTMKMTILPLINIPPNRNSR
jgi:hypothetical protein